MKRNVSFLLALLMLLFVLAACGESGTDAGGTTARPDGTAQPAETDPEDTVDETGDIYAKLPRAEYGGADFPLLQYEESTAATATVCVEDWTGEAVNDAIYQRTINVSDRLGVNITFEKTTSTAQLNDIMIPSIAAGDDHYQAFWQHSTNVAAKYLVQGYLLTMNDISAFDFSAPWWNRNAMDSIRLNDRIYMAFGDINCYLFDFQSIIICSKPYVEDRGVTDLYDLVREGKWTIDAFLAMVEEASEDLNGNGRYGEAADQIGFAGYKTATELAFTHAADAELFSRGEDGVVRYDGVSEKYFDVISRYDEVLGDKGCAEHNEDYMGRFRDGLTVFASCSVGQLSTMRETEFDYLVLPFPKYDEEQESYVSFISNQIQPTVIPVTVDDTDRAGVVLENLCAESYRLVRECYFEKLVNYKYVRDRESIDVLRMLYASDARFEIGHIYGWGSDWGGIENMIADALTGKADTFVSSMEKREQSIVHAIAATMDAISG